MWVIIWNVHQFIGHCLIPLDPWTTAALYCWQASDFCKIWRLNIQWTASQDTVKPAKWLLPTDRPWQSTTCNAEYLRFRVLLFLHYFICKHIRVESKLHVISLKVHRIQKIPSPLYFARVKIIEIFVYSFRWKY